MTHRILYNVNIPRFFVSHRLPLALAAQDAGYDVHITTSDADEDYVAQIVEAGLPYHPLSLAQHGLNPFTEIGTLRSMLRLYRELRPDIVHHVSIKPVIYGGIAARLAGIGAVVSAMSGLGRVFSDEDIQAQLLRQIVTPMFKTALSHPNTSMIFQNPDDRQRFIGMGLIQQERAVLIRGSGVDTDVFVPKPEMDGKPIVLFAGRLMWKKGMREFIDAAQALKEKARFVVVGYIETTSPDAVPEADLKGWADSHLIEWWGKRDDMPAVFAQSHIVCLPSSYGEGVPKVLIEAAASGRPIVATDAPGCREITHDGENGFLFPIGDTSALIEALNKLINSPDLRRSMGAKGRQIVEDGFTLQRVTDETLALYRHLLERA